MIENLHKQANNQVLSGFFWDGVASLLDIAGDSPGFGRYFQHDDLKAIASDWDAVGKDLWHGFNFRPHGK